MKNRVQKIFSKLGFDIQPILDTTQFADAATLAKANVFIERFREVVSDPLNILIERVPEAGYMVDGMFVVLHNGNKVAVSGQYSYYGKFSDLLIINRGVHEPLEEYCYQEVLKRIRNLHPVSIELGAYWSHYSMWLKREFPAAQCIMVEPDNVSLRCGEYNFNLNGYEGEFINQMVSKGDFEVDKFMAERDLKHLDILHSDIQGYEVDMLDGATKLLSDQSADYIFISTHSEDIHSEVISCLKRASYRIEVSSPFDQHTTSTDGFVLASADKMDPLFDAFNPLGRTEIAMASSSELVRSVTR